MQWQFEVTYIQIKISNIHHDIVFIYLFYFFVILTYFSVQSVHVFQYL